MTVTAVPGRHALGPLGALLPPVMGSVLEFATGGHYLEDGNESPTVADDAQARSGVREYALDPGNAQRLWEVSTELVQGRPADE